MNKKDLHDLKRCAERISLKAVADITISNNVIRFLAPHIQNNAGLFIISSAICVPAEMLINEKIDEMMDKTEENDVWGN